MPKFRTCIDCRGQFPSKRGGKVRCDPCGKSQRGRQTAIAPTVARALRSGLLVPQPCEVCGDVKTEGHHDDYSKPLAVRWLCRSHHQMHHRRVARDAARAVTP